MKTIYLILLISALSLLALASLFSSPYFITFHDQVQPERVYEMALAVQSGHIPPRMVQNLGYGLGYPLFNYYAPFPYYIGTIFLLFGLGLIFSTKLMIALGFGTAGISMYIAASRVWGKRGGALAAVLYLLAPYHAVQLYVRGAIGELFAYAVLPLIIIGTAEIYKDKLSKRILLLGLVSIIVLALSHTVSLYMFILVWSIQWIVGFIYLVLCRKNLLRFIKRSVLFCALPLLITTYYWLPAFLEINLTKLSISSGNDVNYADHFITLAQLWSSPWGFGGSTKGVAADGMSFMIGKLLILSVALGLLLIITQKKIYTTDQRNLIIALALPSLLLTFVMMEQSNFLWQIIPCAQLIQFPWRFIMVLTCFLSLIAPSSLIIITKIKNTQLQQGALASLLVAISFTYLYQINLKDFPKTKYFNANGEYQLSDNQLASKDHLRFTASKISDEYLPKAANRPQLSSGVSHDQITCDAPCIISDVIFSSHSYAFSVKAPQNTTIYIDKAYFPNFEATVNGIKKEIDINSPNKMAVAVETGESKIVYYLSNTAIRTVANTISVISLLFILLFGSALMRKTQSHKGKA